MPETTNDNILYIPIQINGGNNIPSALKDRELFVRFNSNEGQIDGLLYVGKENSTDGYIPVAVKYAEESGMISHPDGNFLLSSDRTGENVHSYIAGFQINQNQLLGSQDETPKISNLDLSELHSLNITKDMYGDTLPSTGTVGQIFFKL